MKKFISVRAVLSHLLCSGPARSQAAFSALLKRAKSGRCVRVVRACVRACVCACVCVCILLPACTLYFFIIITL